MPVVIGLPKALNSPQRMLGAEGLAAEMGFGLPVRFRGPTPVISIADEPRIFLISECWRCCS